MSCGSRVESTNIRNDKCKSCRDDIKENGVKKIVCVDCGIEFETTSKASKKIRCNSCQKTYRKEWDRIRKNANSTLQTT